VGTRIDIRGGRVPGDVTREQDFVLHGYAAEPGHGRATIVTYDRPARWRRALLGLGQWWAIALGCVFIPVAHFVLVPSFFLYGIYTFVQRFTTRERTVEARGTCPDCGTEQDFDLGPRWQVPQPVSCRHCHRGMKLTLPDDQPVSR
jgi:hypothetical protein